ncbi:Uu.00g092490.m01.CDS01 [Anthostomella pinea]|uniref:Uu.00g092490.m01.CDS01 n=1 Tax=Anthostomella pinea TaxID=933095 RepID=A0AAI8VHU0_9PEZI|nr:Uu.00g092490.m01.CDS01 [Anthostomella pinea]
MFPIFIDPSIPPQNTGVHVHSLPTHYIHTVRSNLQIYHLTTANNMSSSQTPGNEMSYKDQLDQVAKDARNPNNGKDTTGQPSLIEKVTEYVPAAGKIFGTESQDDKTSKAAVPKETPGPPVRPHHDPSIEEFMRDQHRSKKPDGSLVG